MVSVINTEQGNRLMVGWSLMEHSHKNGDIAPYRLRIQSIKEYKLQYMQITD